MKLRAALLLTSLPLAGLAAPLDPRQVPAHVEWVAHLDVEALRATELGRTFAALVAPTAQKDVVVDVDWDKIIASVASVPFYGLHDPTAGGRRESVAILRGT